VPVPAILTGRMTDDWENSGLLIDKMVSC